MKKTGKKQMLKGLLMALVFTFGVFAWCSDSVVSFAIGTAKVVAGSGKIRQSADTKSQTVASVKKNDKLDVISYKTDSNGYTWYKVYVNAHETGYIRSDLVTVEGKIAEEKTEDSTSSNSSENASDAAPTEVNVSETDVAAAKTIVDVRVRKGAGTNFGVVGQADKGTEVTVTGIAADAEGKNWYQISFNESNKTVNGFIREDLLEVLSRVEASETEEPTEETPEEEPVSEEEQDYYLKYMQNDVGEMDWYLFDNTKGTAQSLTQILNVVEKVKNNEIEDAKELSDMHLIIIALAVATGILIIVVTVLIFKLRDAAYGYEYEEEEEDDEEEIEEEDSQEYEEEEEEEEETEEETTARKPLFRFGKKREVMEEEEEEIQEEEPLKEIQLVKPSKSAKTQTQAWQSKDFLELDDDMEFEFLDL